MVAESLCPVFSSKGLRNIVTITEAGRKQVTGLDRLLGAAQEEFLAPLPVAGRRHLIDLLTRLIDHHS